MVDQMLPVVMILISASEVLRPLMDIRRHGHARLYYGHLSECRSPTCPRYMICSMTVTRSECAGQTRIAISRTFDVPAILVEASDTAKYGQAPRRARRTIDDDTHGAT